MYNSPNCSSRNGWTPDRIVMHVCEGTFKGSVSWLCNKESGASAHFVTGKNGERADLVPLDKSAWCNGTSVKPGHTFFYGNSTLDFVRERKVNANWYTISIENEGYSYKDLYGGLTEKQYATVLEICKEVITKYPSIKIDRQHIIGHYEIAPKGKPNCPGKNFPFDRLIKDLKEWEDEKMIKELSEKYGEENVKKAFVRLIESVNDDGKPAEWAEDEFKEAVDLKITDGNRPEDLATRQEVAIMIKRAVSK